MARGKFSSGPANMDDDRLKADEAEGSLRLLTFCRDPKSCIKISESPQYTNRISRAGKHMGPEVFSPTHYPTH